MNAADFNRTEGVPPCPQCGGELCGHGRCLNQVKRPPLTNAQKQAAYAARRKIKLQRLAAYEAALREIAGGGAASPADCARQALAADRFEFTAGE